MTPYKILLLQHFSDHNIKIIYVTQAIYRKPRKHFYQSLKLESVYD